MNIKYINNNIYIENDGSFDISKTFDCGQCFRFEKQGDIWQGMSFGRTLRLHEEPGFVVLEGVGEQEFTETWQAFFDLDRDYNAINCKLGKDSVLEKAIAVSRGIRILKQDKWETLISFIISQNNNIPRIKGIISRLCEIGGGVCFPTAGQILTAGQEGLAGIRAGFREKYIIDAAERVYDGRLELDALDKLDYTTAKERLKTVKGVGDKVADCVLLFAYGKLEAFPKDVWIKRVIDKYYGDTFDETRFSPYGGIAQQYLFYYEREVSKTSAPT